MDNIGKRLRNLREKCGFTQWDVAKLLGVQRLVVTNIEHGSRKITAEELYIFSKIYGCTMEELYTGEDREERVTKVNRIFEELSEKSQKDVIEFIKYKKYLEDNK